jgi:hypothetical protein
MGLTRFSIDLGVGGRGHINIDGVDIADRVRRVSVDSAAGEVPKVFLELLGEGRIEGEGIVTQMIDLDQRQVVAEWLGTLDAGALESAALDLCGGLGGMSTGEAFLEALKGYVRGDNDGS